MLSQLFTSLIDTVFPRQCVGCGIVDTWLCDVCVRDHLSARRIPLVREARHETGIHSITTLGVYGDQVWQSVVRTLKFHGVRDVAQVTGSLLGDIAHRTDHLPMESPIVLCVVPIPLHPRRERERGFNQSLLLANAIAGRLRDLVPCTVVVQNLLTRQRNTASQTEQRHDGRAANVASVFACNDMAIQQYTSTHGRFTHTRILLVDDVVTTGATVTAAARALQQLNPATLDVLAIARGETPR